MHGPGHRHTGGPAGPDGAEDRVEANANQQRAADPVTRPALLIGDVVADEQADDGHPRLEGPEHQADPQPGAGINAPDTRLTAAAKFDSPTDAATSRSASMPTR